MAIKMRNNEKSDTVCCNCNTPVEKVLNMFDVCIGANTFTICDECNSILFAKTLKAQCLVNGREKSSTDMAIIRNRQNKKFKLQSVKSDVD